MAYRVIQVGAGGWGSKWCERFLPANAKDGLIEVVAVVDTNPETHERARKFLGLRAGHCYTDIEKAFDENPAEICTVVVPPAFHEQVVDVALAHGCHILSEKPIADTLAASVRIADKVKAAGSKMGVTMSHRFSRTITSLRRELRSGRNGPLDYLVYRFSDNARAFGSWGEFRHEMSHPLLIEGSIHHLDILADLAGARCDTIYAQTWSPSWGEFAGDSQALVTMHFENGTRAFYEGATCNAVGLNGWGRDHIRAECEKATVFLSRGRLERFEYEPAGSDPPRVEGEGEEVPLLEQPKWANTWLIEKFVRWLDGRDPMETNVEDNLQSVAVVFAAIESSRTGQPVRVQDCLAKARRDA